MRILYLCGNYGLDLEKMLGPKLSGLKKAGHQPILVTVQKEKELPSYQSFEVHILEHKYARGFIHRIIPYIGLIDSLNVFLTIRKIHKRNPIDVIHERYTGLSWGGILASKFYNIPLIMQMVGPGIEEKEIQGYRINSSQKYTLLVHQKLMMKSQQCLILISRKIAEFIKIKRGWKIPSWYVIHDGAATRFDYNQQKIDELRIKYKLMGYKVIIYTGSLYRWYGILRIIKAFKIVTTQVPDVKLLLIGDGDAISEITEYIEQNNIQDKVIIIQTVPHSEMNIFLQIADIALAHYIDKHTYTGNTAKISEYMAAGKVIVVTPNMDELITNGITGFISPTFVIEDYAKTIIKALNHNDKKLIGKNARDLILKQYTWNHYIEKLLNIYKIAKRQKK